MKHSKKFLDSICAKKKQEKIEPMTQVKDYQKVSFECENTLTEIHIN